MNKSDIIRYLSAQYNLSRREAQDILESLFSIRKRRGIIVKSLLNNEKVTISGFGTFCLRKLGCRTIKVPTKHGERVLVPSRCYVNFKPGKSLRSALKKFKQR